MPAFAYKLRFGRLILIPRTYQETRKPLFVRHVLLQGHYVIWPVPFRHFPLAHLSLIAGTATHDKLWQRWEVTTNIGWLPKWIGNGVPGGDRDLIEGLSRQFSGGTPKTTKTLSQYTRSKGTSRDRRKKWEVLVRDVPWEPLKLSYYKQVDMHHTHTICFL